MLLSNIVNLNPQIELETHLYFFLASLTRNFSEAWHVARSDTMKHMNSTWFVPLMALWDQMNKTKDILLEATQFTL